MTLFVHYADGGREIVAVPIKTQDGDNAPGTSNPGPVVPTEGQIFPNGKG